MGESAAETVREIEETRERLTEELDELQARLPPAASLGRRLLRVAAGSGLGGSILWYFLRRRRSTPEIVEMPPVQVNVEVVPERWAEALDSGRFRAIAAIGASAWFVLKVMELRRARTE